MEFEHHQWDHNECNEGMQLHAITKSRFINEITMNAMKECNYMHSLDHASSMRSQWMHEGMQLHGTPAKATHCSIRAALPLHIARAPCECLQNRVVHIEAIKHTMSYTYTCRTHTRVVCRTHTRVVHIHVSYVVHIHVSTHTRVVHIHVSYTYKHSNTHHSRETYLQSTSLQTSLTFRSAPTCTDVWRVLSHCTELRR
jgi:hypothetical protein